MARQRNTKRGVVRKVTTTIYISLENDDWLRTIPNFNLSHFIDEKLDIEKLKNKRENATKT